MTRAPMQEVSLRLNGVRQSVLQDGSILLSNCEELEDFPLSVSTPMLAWARSEPARVAIADRIEDPTTWRVLTYADLDARSASIAQALLESGISTERPLMLISENRIEAALTIVACLRAGLPIAPITPAYSGGQGDPRRLGAILDTLKPGMIIVDRPERHSKTLKQAGRPLPVMVGMEPHNDFLGWDTLRDTAPGPALEQAEVLVATHSVAKILFTSGSTGTPKGAINTHGMLASNVQAIRQGWPFLRDEPPIVVDWLPWNHTFGGNYVFNSVLSVGGTLYIDDGKPLPGLVTRSVENNASVQPTIHFNAPRGLDVLARILGDDPKLAHAFFERLGVVFFASAGLAPRVRAAWADLIRQYARRNIKFVSAWGTTETAPLSTALNYDPQHVNNIGTPIPGTTIKLGRIEDRYEIRVKGPNVSPGYLGQSAPPLPVDEDGFFCSGDLGRLADARDPSAGILIEGRLAEDFKLDSGTWVNVTGLRTQLLEVIGPIARDVVLSGANRRAIAALIFLDVTQCIKRFGASGEAASITQHAALVAHIAQSICQHNDANPGGSRRIFAHHIMRRDLDPGAGEVTEKGTVNQAAVLKREAVLCNQLDESAQLAERERR
jgi:feruloyl-CoA synthase